MTQVKQFAVIDRDLLLQILGKTNPSPDLYSGEIQEINSNIEKQENSKSTARTKLAAINQLLSKKRVLNKRLKDSKLGGSSNPLKIEYANNNQTRDDFNESDPWVLSATSSLGKTGSTNAINLMKYIHSSGAIGWDENGRLVLQGKIQPKTNIADLVSDAVRSSRTRTPAHMHAKFARELKKINTPRNYIKNKEYLNPSETEREDIEREYYAMKGTPQPVAKKSRISTETPAFQPRTPRKKPYTQSGHGIAHWITKLL